jgi:hypothetical protein
MLGIAWAAGLLLTVPMFAQKPDIFHAQIRGGGGDRGKCTIEVNVDGVAEIEIRADEGRMRTLSGAASTWRRMECTEPLPENPLDFHFSGVDGRGSQKLLRDPASNRGTAVVRIEDPQGGREGYTFDIEWRGAGASGVRGDGRDRDEGARGGPGPGPGGPRWDDEIRFTGRGDGYFKNFRDPDEVLRDCQISIDRSGVVNVTFQNARRTRLTFTGQLTRFEQGLIVADMSGAGVRGSMEILRIGPDRITDIAMSAEGRERFELNWHR